MKERVEKLRAALQCIAEGGVDRDVAHRWNSDEKPSKHDRCVHRRAMWEDCGECIAEYAEKVLREDEHNSDTM